MDTPTPSSLVLWDQGHLDPKVRGTWNLDVQLPADLDFFVLLSSIAGINGAASQSPYAGASVFEDAFARAALRLAGPGRRTRRRLRAERVDVARFLAMSMTDHKALAEEEVRFMVRYACSPLANGRGGANDEESTGTAQHRGFYRRAGQLRRVAAANSLPGAADVITRALARRLARALAVPVEDTDVHKPPFAFGVESLVAVELFFWFSNEVRASISVIQILGDYTLAQLAALAAAMHRFTVSEIKEDK
ncbi:Beta-ketoacyl synthase domain-containing protein [Apiospora kogelbergensis]|uniref:Beta-ketoacyl synthase domain-containing protein n=1 Tax=Apiospora kogelbergensis TaxID=1337665 RepID=UPI003130D8B4